MEKEKQNEVSKRPQQEDNTKKMRTQKEKRQMKKERES